MEDTKDTVVQYPDFCTELRQKTQKIHDQSDRLINLKLAIVLTDTQLWAEVLADFYFVFQTIETCLVEHHENPHVRPLYHRDMLRREAFEKDLEFYVGKDWSGTVKPSPAATVYCDRILEAVNEDPALLVAYVHSMYLGLVAGGQIIRRIVKRTLGLSGSDGLSIFEFKNLYKTELRQHIYNSINNLDLEEDKKKAIIQEKIRCFQMNNAIASNVKPSMRSAKRLSSFLVAIILILFCLVLLLVYLFRVVMY